MWAIITCSHYLWGMAIHLQLSLHSFLYRTQEMAAADDGARILK